MIQLSFCVSLGAEERETLVPEVSRLGGVEDRRAEAMGKRMERFETMAGRVYEDVRITRINDAGISFFHSAGAARLRFENLTPEQRGYFGINWEDAAAVYAREMRSRVAYERMLEEREAARRAVAEKEVAARVEAARLAMEKAKEEPAVVAFTEPAATIPEFPTIKRVESVRHDYRGFYHSGFRFTYPAGRWGYRQTFQYRAGGCGPFYRSGIHFSVR